MQSVGEHLKHARVEREMSVAEIARHTRIPVTSLEALEEGRFDDLPGEIFARGFIQAYARALGLNPQEVLSLHDGARQAEEWMPSAPLTAPGTAQGKRFGVALAVVLLLVLFTLALSIVLKPRGRDVPQELSGLSLPVDSPFGSPGEPAGGAPHSPHSGRS